MSSAILFPGEILPNFGNVKIQPFVKLKNETVYPEKIEISKGFSGKNYQIDCFYSKDFADTLYMTVYDREVRVKRIFKNNGPEIKLMELGCLFTEIKLGNNCDKDFFYHNENPRIYERMTFPVDYVRAPEDAKDSEYDDTAGNRWADPGVVHPRIGRSPYQPFPAILLGNYETSNGIVHGTLRQKECYHNYLVRHENGTVTLEVFSSFKAVDALDFAQGRQLNDQWYIGEVDDAKDFDKIFNRYTAHLRKVLPASYGSTDINRTCMTWGSWNDNIYREITEEMLLRPVISRRISRLSTGFSSMTATPQAQKTLLTVSVSHTKAMKALTRKNSRRASATIPTKSAKSVCVPPSGSAVCVPKALRFSKNIPNGLLIMTSV